MFYINSDPEEIREWLKYVIKAPSTLVPAITKTAEFKELVARAIEDQTFHVNTGVSQLPDLNDSEVQSLWSGCKWNTDVIRYSFNSTIPEEYQSNPELTDHWQPFSEEDKQIVREIFEDISKFTSLKFEEVQEDGDIRFNKVDMTDANGFAFYPPYADFLNTPEAGDIWLSNEYDDYGNAPGTFGYYTILHEIGHALGLKHPFEGYPVLSEDNDDTLHTVMSYTPKQTLTFDCSLTLSNESHENSSGSKDPVFICDINFLPVAFPDNYQLYDIMALQAIYGANTEANTGNDIYRVSDLYREHKHLVIWDAGGIDTIDASDTTHPDYIDLRDGIFSSIDIHPLREQMDDALSYLIQNIQEIQGDEVSEYQYQQISSWLNDEFSDPAVSESIYTGERNLAIAKGTIIENAITGSGNDIVVDNEYNNIISTNGGDDIIYVWEGGFDIINGDEGQDTVVVGFPYAESEIKYLGDNMWYISDRERNSTVLLVGVEHIAFEDGISILYSESEA